MIPTESISELNIGSNLNRKSVCENTDKLVLKLELRYIAIMSGIAVTQALCSNFSVRSNGGLLKQNKTLEWTPYLAGVTAAVLHPHLPKLQSILKWELSCIYNGNPYIWKDSLYIETGPCPMRWMAAWGNQWHSICIKYVLQMLQYIPSLL